MSKASLKHSDLADDKFTPKGKYLVAELIDDHHQRECEVVLAGTRGYCIAGPGNDVLFRFPHEKGKPRNFSDCQVRIADRRNLKPLGRINLK